MTGKPAYFERIRYKAMQRWDQLEEDRELAGPWHQLFRQVQSPRHVLSELLQNADDAGATDVTVRIEDQIFSFEHNGLDFTEDHFASLCSFGFSKKKTLHTIGFRGVGFKSTFSLGDQVEVCTPTLAFRFDRERFTEPHWISETSTTDGATRIQVRISDDHRKRHVEKNLDEWLESPLALLFFKNIRQLRIGDRLLCWHSSGSGPIPGSEWMVQRDQGDEPVLLLRSGAEHFPEDAYAEIRQERTIGIDDDHDWPTCHVEIVMGAPGRLFVVLPTLVETALPFACNAPFIQDPARLKIKDPETSPTNRWLLDRAGQLAASAMLMWIGRTDLPIAERSIAYGLLPDVDRDDNSLEGVCGVIVEEAFDDAIEGCEILLTDAGDLTARLESIVLPQPVFDIWPAEQAAAFLDQQHRPALCRHVSSSDREKLLHWGLVEEVEKQDFLATLRAKHLPKPATWGRLLNLWSYIAPDVTGYRRYSADAKGLRIVPVLGKEVLYAATEAVRLGERKLLESAYDWNFLASYMLVLNQNWPRFLSQQQRRSADETVKSVNEAIDGAYAILEEIGLDDTSDAKKVLDRVAADFFAQEIISLQGAVRLAQITAKLVTPVGNAFRYATRDTHFRLTEEKILFDESGRLEDLVPEGQRGTRLLHPAYTESFTSCSREEWLRWITSSRAGLHTFVPLVQKRIEIYRRSQIQQEARMRGLVGDLSYRYVTNQFAIEDWDFEEIYWRHWETLAESDEHVWMRIALGVLSQHEGYWNRAKSVRLLHVATTGNTKPMTSESLLPTWILRLRELPCLPDTHGLPLKPGELLRRTAETESLLEVDPFVDRRIDTEANQPLLDLLGLQSTPAGPDHLLDCIRTLAQSDNPPLHEVEKWYRRLDKMVDTCSTTDLEAIRQAFWSEKLIITQEGDWVLAASAFLSTDEDEVPSAAVVRSPVGDLTLWRRIGVAERPTAELAIQWLKSLPSGEVLRPEEIRRVRALLARYPLRVWGECAHWLNLANEWIPTRELAYALTMQSLIPWRHLHLAIKQKTADLQHLPEDLSSDPPFSLLPSLAQSVEERLHRDLSSYEIPESKPWLTIFGREMQALKLDSEEGTARIRAIAERLGKTDWYATPVIEVVPYIDGIPAGTARWTDVVWLNEELYVTLLPMAKLAKRVPEEIGKVFNRSDIKAALDYSFERSPEEVREYLHENFKLTANDRPKDVAEGTVTLSLEPDAGKPDQPLVVSGASDETCNYSALGDRESLEPPREEDRDLTAGPDRTGIRPRPAPTPDKPSIIERFARAQGFRKDNDERFFHEDGSWICRVRGAPFPWERRTATGDLFRCYWPNDHCLEREPLQLEADVWGLIDRYPETYALILSDAEGVAVEIGGSRLRAMRDGGEVTLYPAAYRLVYNHNRHAG